MALYADSLNAIELFMRLCINNHALNKNAKYAKFKNKRKWKLKLSLI